MDNKTANKNHRITTLRRLVLALKVLHKTARLVKYPFLLFLLLLSTEFHQAVERSSMLDSRAQLNLLIEKNNNDFDPAYLNHINEKVDLIVSRSRLNGAVLIAKNGSVIYENYSGYADLRSPRKEINENTVFQLASVSKQFTAVAVMMLKEKGYFEFDDPVYNYIKGFPYPEITIRHLLNHTSGLQNYMYLLDNFWDKDRYPTNQDLVDMFVKYEMPLNFSPGRRFAYSNTGYAFLALLVEEVTSISFADYLKNELFLPLGMKNTFAYCVNDNNYIANRALGYWSRNPRRLIPADYHDGILGDKGILSSPADLLRWSQVLSFLPPISEESMSEATTRALLNNGRSVSYGFGWRLKKVNNYDFVYHHGWWRGFRTAFKIIPEKDIVIIALNNTNHNIGHIVRQINNVVLEEFKPELYLLAESY